MREGNPSPEWRVHPTFLLHPGRFEGRRTLLGRTSAADPPLIIRDSRVAAFISALPERFTEAQALALGRGLFDQDRQPFDILVAEAVIVPCNSSFEEHDRWAEDGWWAASLFHHATRDFPFLAMDQPDSFDRDEERMATYSAETLPPPRDIDPEGRPCVALKRLPAEDPDEWITNASRECRRSIEGIGALLDLCGGIRGSIVLDRQGEFHAKAVPSGGARHPTEIYLAAFSIDGLDPGIYRYHSPGHQLVELARGDTAEAWRGASFDLFARWRDRPIGVVVLATKWERAMWRYRDDRSARVPFIDIGHVLMAFRTMCRLLDLRIYSYQKFRDSAVAELCQVDPYDVTPLYISTLV